MSSQKGPKPAPWQRCTNVAQADCEEAANLMRWLAKRSDRRLQEVIWRLDIEPLEQEIELDRQRLARWGR